MRLLAFFLSAVCAFGQAGPGLTAKLRAPATVNYYMSTGGSDSNVCSSASKCLTLAHVKTLVPQVLDGRYTINVADGTYAEPLDLSGFIGMGMGALSASPDAGTQTTYLKILGNTTTPANVVFNGSVDCDATFPAVGCFEGSGKVILSGLTATTAHRNGLECVGGVLELSKVIITMTGGPSSDNVGFLASGCRFNIEGDVTITGIDSPSPLPAGGIGIEVSAGSFGTLNNGTLTITGPGTGGGGMYAAYADGTTGMTIDSAGASFLVTSFGGTTAISITQVNSGFWVAENGIFSALGATTITISNSSTPTSSFGIQTYGAGIWHAAFGPDLTVNHFTYCYYSHELGLIDHGRGGGSRTSTNCGTTSAADDNSKVLLY